MIRILATFFLINKIKKRGAFENHVEYVKNRVFNDCRYSVDIKKLEEMGWKIKTCLPDNIDTIVSWYRQHLMEYV